MVFKKNAIAGAGCTGLFFNFNLLLNKTIYVADGTHAFINRIIKKYKKEEDFDYYFNGEIIDRLSVRIENNWKINLINFDYDTFI